MQCRQCGAATRPGMAQCPNCGAQLTKQDGSSSGGYQPQQGYVPGGGSGGSSGSAAPQQPAPTPDGQRRPAGSLGRRLQQSAPPGARGERGGQDDQFPPPQRGARSRPQADDRDPARGYGPPVERGHERRMPPNGRRRGRGYDDGDEHYDDDNPDDARRPRGYDDDAPNEAPGWADGRGRGTPPRRSRDRSAPPLDDASEEMIARRDAPRSGPARRRGGPEPGDPAMG